MSEILISCREVEKIYRKGKQEIRPLQKLSLDVKKGEFLALMGPSGSGKTTLLNLLAGIDTPERGQLIFQGEDIARFNRKKLCRFRAEHVGYIFQLYHLIPVLTAYENVELPLLISSLSAKERHARVCSALEMANIT
ncbi:MAG: ATP-binding cassette domain-containing protein, partial [Lentisphaeraceae bacterium]|nr:ATP-binding cassette domain-containing protein [Lentisphaeraceae bacterium]